MVPDPPWLSQALAGDEEAFTRLVELYQTPVYNLCYRMLGEPSAAEDAAQETFLRAYQNLWRYDPARPFGTWLISIAAHYCIDRMRRKRLAIFSMDENPEIDLPDSQAADPEMEAVRQESREKLHLLLQKLDPIDRTVLVLRYWNDCSEAEIAGSLSLTVSAVKSRLHRARLALARLWEEEKNEKRTERIAYGSPTI